MHLLRRLIFVGLCLGLILLLTGQTTFPQTYYITGRSVNARSCPQTSCSVVTRLSRGTSIRVEGVEDGDSVSGNTTWVRFTYQGTTAYVHSSLASTRNPNSTTTTGGGTNNNSTTTTGGGGGVSCNGARTCSQMTSCAQAQACLAAGRTSLDRDRDGVPCEDICPGG